METLQLKNRVVIEAFHKFNGNQRKLHLFLCSIIKVDPKTVNECSLYSRIKTVFRESRRLNKFTNKNKYFGHLSSVFHFPKQAKKCCKENPDQSQRIIANQYNIISKLKTELSEQKLMLQRCVQKERRLTKTIESLRKSLKLNKKLNSVTYNKSKIQTSIDQGVQCNTMRNLITSLYDEIEYLKLDNEEKDENNNDVHKSTCKTELKTRLSGRGNPYCHKIRELYYKLRSIGISINKIDTVVKSVLTVVDIECGELPSKSTATNMTIEAGCVARQHLNDEITESSNDLTMMRDATTKKGHHYYATQLQTSNKTLTLGVKEVLDGKSETYVDCVKTVLSEVSSETNQHIKKVKNFMTDRSATENKVNNILSIENNLDSNSFKCAVHPLLQFSSVAIKKVTEIEKDLKINNDTSLGDNVSENLLRFVSKLFFKDGSGDPLYAATYLKDNGVLEIPIMNFRGNRFNTIFHNAAGTFYIHKHLINYLTNSKSSLNFSQNFILTSLKNDNVIAICRALGIICKTITEPYWACAGDSEKNALDMGSVYGQLHTLLSTASETPQLLLENKIQLLIGPRLPCDNISSALFEASSSLDNITLIVIKDICFALKEKCKLLFKDFAENGKFHNPSADLYKMSYSCPANNISVERLFGQLDSKLRMAPNSNMHNIESSLIFKNNNTSEWLHKKSEADKQVIINKAMEDSKNVIKNMKERKNYLFDQRVKIIKEREHLKKERDEKKKKIKEKIEKDIKEIGIWNDFETIEINLAKFKTKKEKIIQLKQQINMCKESGKLHLNKEDRALYQFSKKGKQFDVSELTKNLLKLGEKLNSSTCQSHNDIIQPIKACPSSIVNSLIDHEWSDKTWKGRILSFDENEFEIKYWDISEDDNISDNFVLSLDELLHDIEDGTLIIHSS